LIGTWHRWDFKKFQRAPRLRAPAIQTILYAA
jgi:hypothetical protein